MPTEADLYPYQADGVAWLRNGGARLLGDDPGLGKTPQALIAAEGRTLIVAATTLHGQWRHEIEQWRPDLEAEIITYQGMAKRDGRKIIKGKLKDEIAKGEWGTVIFDEATRLKGRKANIANVAEKLCRQTPNAFLLSGTPIPNWAHEWYQLLKIMRGARDHELRSYWRWVDKWFTTYEVNYKVAKVREIGGLRDYWTWDEFTEGNQLDSLYLGRRKADHLPGLPTLTLQPMGIPMRGEQKRLYNNLKNDYVAWVAETGEEVSAWSSGGLHTKLRKAATGVPVVSDSEGPAPKIEAAIEMAADQLPVVMFCQYRRSVEVTLERCERAGYRAAKIYGGMKADEIDRHRRAFQEGDLDVLIGTFEMMSEGLTLTAANVGFLIEKSFRPDLNQQAMDRLHRIGQTRPVTIIDMYTVGSVDEGQRKLLDAKLAQTGEAMESVRRLTAREFAALI